MSNFNINKRLNNDIKLYITSPKIDQNKSMTNKFTPPRLFLLGPASNGFGISIMLKCVKIVGNNTEWGGESVFTNQ